jgi:hypothetical protein
MVGVKVGTVGNVGTVGVSAASRAKVVVETPPPSNRTVVSPRIVVGTVVIAGARRVAAKRVLVDRRAEAFL